MSRRELNRELNELKATVWIGKNGIGESTIEEIKRQIKDSGKVKIKWLRSTAVSPEDVADKTGSSLIQTRGRTMVLQKKRNKFYQIENFGEIHIRYFQNGILTKYLLFSGSDPEIYNNISDQYIETANFSIQEWLENDNSI